MNARKPLVFTVLTLIALFTAPVRIAQKHQDHRDKHDRYKLMDLGTFGGPESYINPAFTFGSHNQINRQPIYQGQISETHISSSRMVNLMILSANYVGFIYQEKNPALALATFPMSLNLGDGTFTGLPDCRGATCGVVFKVDPNGNETVLHSFSGPDGAFPGLAGLALDAAGNVYGATYEGGIASACPIGCGVVFRVDTSGKETVLYSFSGGSDGLDPTAGVFVAASGDLYGTALLGGGTYSLGTVFKLSPVF